MTLEKFIKKNRSRIDRAIKRIYPNVKLLNDAERKIWVLNEVALFHWAEAQGVKIDGELKGRYWYDSFLSRLVRKEEASDQSMTEEDSQK